jgi:hypothetical protein
MLVVFPMPLRLCPKCLTDYGWHWNGDSFAHVDPRYVGNVLMAIDYQCTFVRWIDQDISNGIGIPSSGLLPARRYAIVVESINYLTL